MVLSLISLFLFFFPFFSLHPSSPSSLLHFFISSSLHLPSLLPSLFLILLFPLSHLSTFSLFFSLFLFLYSSPSSIRRVKEEEEKKRKEREEEKGGVEITKREGERRKEKAKEGEPPLFSFFSLLLPFFFPAFSPLSYLPLLSSFLLKVQDSPSYESQLCIHPIPFVQLFLV